MLIQAAPLTRTLVAMLTAAGATPKNAQICADHLVTANLKGHDSHGVGMVPSYIHGIRAGKVFPNAHPRIAKDSGAVLLIDGQFGLGQVVAKETMKIALDRVRSTGVVCVGLRNATHIGRIGSYGEQCADAGFVSTHYVNVVGHGPLVVPHGGRAARMVTNPYCCVVPRPDGNHIALDMATSNVAAGKVRVAHMKGVPMPAGNLVDADGNPTNNPAVLYTEPRGALMPFGTYKGYGLMVMCELLGGGLAGNWTMRPEQNRDYGTTINNMLSIIIDPDAFGGRDAFEEEVTGMIHYLRTTPPADGYTEVLVPGDPERRTMALRREQGIDIDDNSWKSIADAAAKVGIEQPEFAALAAA